MKIKTIGEPRVIMSNPTGKHNYFAWPTVARLQNGKIAVVASGYRISHVCPFGKLVISYSENEGETYTVPAPVIDTPLDDRDGGILAFGEKNVIVTSFNNTLDFQKKRVYSEQDNITYRSAYMDTVTKEEEQKYLGSNFRISNDCGVTFGEIKKSPVTTPHGPLVLRDGTVLWVGKFFGHNTDKTPTEGNSFIQVHKVNPDGTTEYVGQIESASDEKGDLVMSEPYAIELDDGTLICHIRTERLEEKDNFNYYTTELTLYQSESKDGGKTWTKPHAILPPKGGAPAHLMKHSSGALISVHGYREKPYGIKAMFSFDNGKTWDCDNYIFNNGESPDMGYPTTVELSDGSLLTVFYAKEKENGPCVIMQQKWTFEK